MSEIHSMKICFKCGNSKTLDEFYKHSKMADGHLNKCKECTKRDVKQRYIAEPKKIAAYERKRFKCPARKTKVILYQRRRRAKNPEKTAARKAVRDAIASGKIVKLPCMFCGNPDSQAHHDDYKNRLAVKWACFRCHREKFHGQRVNV
jgi:hypothetical protein